jgi:ATPase subunit of ABC transporter with duplicated ATPase domains
LFLDEPTNHLDLPSIERLQAALVLITHDEALARSCTRAHWMVERGRLRI